MTSTSPSPAVASAAAMLSSFCGRDPQSGQFRVCAHDHTADGEAFVRMVEQTHFPALLRELLAEGSDASLADRARAEADGLEEQARVVPTR